MANSTIESALYTLVKCGENLILAINSVLWVCAHKGVFYIQKNFSKNFSIHPNISPVSFGRYIIKLSIRKLYDESGQVHYCIDETLRRRLETKLITKILAFEVA